MLDELGARTRSLMDVVVSAGVRDARTGSPMRLDTTPLARALRGQTVEAEEYILNPSKQGEPVWVRVSGFPLRDRGGLINGAVAVVTDITAETGQALAMLEQELAERRRTDEALQSSQQRLRLAMEASGMSTWDYDARDDRIVWSDEVALITGAPVEAAAVPLAEGLSHVHPEDRAAVERAIREALDFGNDLQIETRILIGPSKRVRWLLAKGRVYRDEFGRPVRMTGIAMDITERKEAQAVRRSAAHGERLRALGEMASGIAHDLNQSLALITGYSDMVRQELNLGVPEVGRVREMIDITARAAHEGGRALKGLLSFVRTQDLIAEIERIDTRALLEDAARLSAPRWRDKSQAEGRPIHLEVHAEPGSWINGSPAELREAITNLIFNAVDAMPRGGSICLRALRQREHVVIEVSDTGTGIPPEILSRVFDPFFSTKGEHGTGLGLPQVQAIVEKHGGSIDLESTVDRGSAFRLKFPRASAPNGHKGGANAAAEMDETARLTQSAEGSDQVDASPDAQAGQRGRSIRVLIVEDEEQLARMARIVLTQQGHQVDVAASGEEALERLVDERFDLIISDLGLGPGKNGWDVAHETRERWPGTRFVLVTGWGAAIDPQEAKARGVDEVLAKPYRIADLRQVADHVADAQDNG
jgi:PAS domain S-box-containing protein